MIPGSVSLIHSSHPVSPASLLLRDRRSGADFLVDSGADISVLPASPSDLAGRPSARLVAANGSTIRAFGSKSLPLKFDGLATSHKFLVAEVKKPILGADFFSSHRLLIDLQGRRLLRLPPDGSHFLSLLPVVVAGTFVVIFFRFILWSWSNSRQLLWS